MASQLPPPPPHTILEQKPMPFATDSLRINYNDANASINSEGNSAANIFIDSPQMSTYLGHGADRMITSPSQVPSIQLFFPSKFPDDSVPPKELVSSPGFSDTLCASPLPGAETTKNPNCPLSNQEQQRTEQESHDTSSLGDSLHPPTKRWREETEEYIKMISGPPPVGDAALAEDIKISDTSSAASAASEEAMSMSPEPTHGRRASNRWARLTYVSSIGLTPIERVRRGFELMRALFGKDIDTLDRVFDDIQDDIESVDQDLQDLQNKRRSVEYSNELLLKLIYRGQDVIRSRGDPDFNIWESDLCDDIY